jgi:hypothetical protein
MLFTPAIVSAILATSALAAPYYKRTNDQPQLSLTQQLSIADTAVDRYALIPKNEDFKFDFSNPALQGKGGNGGDLITANRQSFPALVGSGSGMAVGFLGPCGFNTPHIHPRAVELQIVTEGRLYVEMAPENNVFNSPGNATSGRRVITNMIEKNQMTPFYLGSVHTQFNPDCTNATFVASFNSEDFGAGQVADELFALSDDVVSAAFGQAIDGADVAKFKKSIPATIALGVAQCLKTCGIKQNAS